MIYIVDYGSGNLRSVQKAFEHLDVYAEVGSDVRRMRDAKGLVLPGVGAFGAAMADLESRELVEPIRERVLAGVPFLGVCLGLQLLFESSQEAPGVAGLGLLPGDVRRLPSSVKVPHIGWNQIEIMQDSDLLQGIPDHAAFYFVHSYVVVPLQVSDVLTVTDYEELSFVSGVQSGNVSAFQFHPEKSSSTGLKIYDNFARLAFRQWI
jgi:glutamine amidotransferase